MACAAGRIGHEDGALAGMFWCSVARSTQGGAPDVASNRARINKCKTCMLDLQYDHASGLCRSANERASVVRQEQTRASMSAAALIA